MNIMVIGKFCIEGFAMHISETLTQMGHSVKRFEAGCKQKQSDSMFAHRLNQVRSVIFTDTDRVPFMRALHMKKLWHEAQSGPLDLIIVCYDFLWPSEVAKLKTLTSAKIVMWFPDAITNFSRAFFMNSAYDALFFKDPYILQALDGVLASPAYYLPECFNPAKHFLPAGVVPAAKYHCDLTTAGNAHSWRVAFFKHLTKYNIKIWGSRLPLWMPNAKVGRMFQNEYVFNQEKAAAFLGAKIVLNNLHYGEVWGVNARTFEAAGIGAFQMINWRLGLSHLFAEDSEIITFRDIPDLQHKIEYWLNQPEEKRLEIASAGKKRAYAEHTYEIRLNLLLATVFNSATGFPPPVF